MKKIILAAALGLSFSVNAAGKNNCNERDYEVAKGAFVVWESGIGSNARRMITQLEEKEGKMSKIRKKIIINAMSGKYRSISDVETMAYELCEFGIK